MTGAFFGPGGPACTVTRAEGISEKPTGEDILVQSLSASQRRVVDRRLPEAEACNPLGLVEEEH